MIISKLQGGLGNQLFQWAFAKSLSLRYNTPLFLDISFYKIPLNPKREFSLDRFPNISYKLTPNDPNLSNWSNEKNKNKIQKLTDTFVFNDISYDESSHYYLDGYWQSEKYFKQHSKEIQNELSPNELTLKKIQSIPFISENNISLHVRRTDYIKSNGYHPVQSVEYYKSAIDLIGDYDYIFVFSDDINWCKENLKFKNMIFMTDFTDLEDICIMSMCKNNIIANSSFSWWGAWLNRNSNKKVISPKKWFGQNANLYEGDIQPQEWIKI
jgi:hypothetical protein